MKWIIIIALIIVAIIKKKDILYFVKHTVPKAISSIICKLRRNRIYNKKHYSKFENIKNIIANANTRKYRKQFAYYYGAIPNLMELKIVNMTNQYDPSSYKSASYSSQGEKASTANPVHYNLEQELSAVIGLKTVKDYIRGLSAYLKVQAEKEAKGLKTGGNQTMHMIFTGNPGTGKTTMARIVANVLHECGAISTNKLVETDRSGLVGQYIGETAQKTKEVINSALGGVLFIDEAYSLSQGGDKDFGKEAIDTLVKMMEDNRDNLVVILAGYTEDMNRFIDTNAGLKSRFANIIEFPDYTNGELLQITYKLCRENGCIIAKDAEPALINAFNKARSEKHFSNGREARNILEKAIRNQSLRLSRSSNHSCEELQTIIASDIL